MVEDRCEFVMCTAVQADGLCYRLTKPCPKAAPTRYELSYSMKDQYEVGRESLEKKELLGAGNFGEVWRGTCRLIRDLYLKRHVANVMFFYSL